MHGGRARWALQAAGLAVYLAALASAETRSGRSGPGALAEQAVELAGALEREVEGALGRLQPVARQVGGGEALDWRSFSRALDPPAGPRAAGLVVWAPQVAASARSGYELATGGDTFRSFVIREPDGGGGLRAAARRDEHFPVHLADPPAPSSRLLGLDLLAEPALAEAIDRARRSHLPQVSLLAPAALAPGPRRLVIVLPIGQGPRLRGVLVAALDLPAAAAASLAPDLAVRLAPGAAATPRARHASARAAFYVRGQAWAVEVAAPRR